MSCGRSAVCVVGVAAWPGSRTVDKVVKFAFWPWLLDRGRFRRRFSVCRVFAGLRDDFRFGHGCDSEVVLVFGLQL